MPSTRQPKPKLKPFSGVLARPRGGRRQREQPRLRPAVERGVLRARAPHGGAPATAPLRPSGIEPPRAGVSSGPCDGRGGVRLDQLSGRNAGTGMPRSIVGAVE